MPAHELLPFLLLVIGMALTPGPNMMLYISHTLGHGRAAGWITVAGITTAFIFHITATMLGITALLIAVPIAYDILRYAGIAYLLWLAYKNLQTKEWINAETAGQDRKLSYFYVRGFVGNILNPQTTILYFSLLPQFIHPERGRAWLQTLQLGAIQMAGSTITNLLIVFVVSKASAKFLQNAAYQKYIRYTMSSLLALFALKLLFSKK
ncbi:MAG: LysE family translocator [Chitinophagaceae bacterium]|nr:LysE family translocator [Chitinophagaceae bacterium]